MDLQFVLDSVYVTFLFFCVCVFLCVCVCVCVFVCFRHCPTQHASDASLMALPLKSELFNDRCVKHVCACDNLSQKRVSTVERSCLYPAQIERGEWERVNKELRAHGMPSVSIVHPHHAAKYSGTHSPCTHSKCTVRVYDALRARCSNTQPTYTDN